MSRKTGKPKKPRAKPAKLSAALPAELSAQLPDEEAPAREEESRGIIERPDGFYWLAKSGKEYGPFDTLADAEADMLSGAGAPADADAAESLPEAESEIGMTDWIDPDTGGPAEDSVPRLEDH